MTTLSTPRVLFVLTSSTPVLSDGKKSGWYWSELYYPYEEFIKSDFECDAMSLNGSSSPDEHSTEILSELMTMEVSAMAAWRNSSHSIHKMIANLKNPSNVNPAKYDIIYFVGGHGCLYDLPTATSIHEIAATIYEKGGIVAAVCHGPAVFQGLKLHDGTLLIRGKRATGFTEEEEQKVGLLEWIRKENKLLIKEIIEGGGGHYSQEGVMKNHVIVDGRVLTGQNSTSAGPLAVKCVHVWQNLENHPLKSNTAANIISSAAIAGDGNSQPSIKQKQQLHDYVEQPDFKQ